MSNKIISIDNLRYYNDKINQRKQDVLISGNNIKTINGESILGKGDMKLETIALTYSELFTLRDNAELIPGQQYRITDYATTTSQQNTQSAGHSFDIIVTALDEYTLSEEAHATQNNDGYFDDSDLSAWKLWYCLDNDTNRFSWADTTNGKGVIYRMIDEFGNDCPYDFKNIQFLRGLYDNGGLIPYHEPNGDEDLTAYCYTFGWENEDGTMLDTTIFCNNGTLLDDAGQLIGVYGNIIKANFNIDNPTNVQQRLNNIVFLSTYYYETGLFYGYYSNSFEFNCYDNSFGNNCSHNSFGNGCNNNSFGNGCGSNSFGEGCYSNSFEFNCYDNSFGNGCNNNSFGNNCDSNTFGNDCHGNSFGTWCGSNSFGSSCYNNSFGSSCYSNSFGVGCYNNSFGHNYSSNSFGNNCTYISFGTWCQYNSFGNDCHGNSFGNDCHGNSFGNDCHGNSFRNSASKTGTLKDYCSYNHFDDGCSYNVIWNMRGTGSSVQLKNINVNRGVVGTSSSYNLINIETLNSEKEININNYNEHIYIDYGDIFKVTYNELVDLRDNSQLIPGRQYRITDYVTTTSQEATQSAGHQFDVIVTAVDENTLSETALAAIHDGDTYFTGNGANLDAWEIKYALDSDTDKFYWAGNETTISEEVEVTTYNSAECTINSELIDGNAFLTPFNFESCVWVDSNMDAYNNNQNNHDINELVYEWGYFTDENDNTQLCLYKSNADIYEQEGQPDYGDKYLYRGVVNVDGTDYDYWQKWDTETKDVIMGDYYGGYVYATTARIVSNPEAYSFETTTETVETTIQLNPKGVIYYMKDEWGNECPYDFKNIMFLRDITIDADSGMSVIAPKSDTTQEVYCYTFNYRQTDGVMLDTSIYGNNGTLLMFDMPSEVSFNKMNSLDTFGLANLPGVNTDLINYSLKQYFLNHIVFYVGGDRFYEPSTHNIFGVCCHNMTFGNTCSNNSFGDRCYNNLFGRNYIINSFGHDCSGNSFGNNCSYNSFGNDCHNNSFGESCSNNTLGNGCSNNSFGNSCHDNSFGNNCSYNSFGYNCYDNSFEFGCSNNSFGRFCLSNIFGNTCHDNHVNMGGNGMPSENNVFGNNCYDIKLMSLNSFNNFGHGCSNISLRESSYYNTFGNNCGNITIASSDYNDTSLVVSYNKFSDETRNVKIIDKDFIGSTSSILGNYNFISSFAGTSSDNPITIELERGRNYETKVAYNSNGEIKIYCEADLIL